MGRDATAEEIVQAIKEGISGAWTLRCQGLTKAGLAAFQSQAEIVIGEARRNGLTPKVHRTSEQGFRWVDTVTVEIPLMLGPKTFHQFLVGYQRQRSPEGDFARDALKDQTFPAITSWPQLQHHLLVLKAPKASLDAALRVWTAYEESK